MITALLVNPSTPRRSSRRKGRKKKTARRSRKMAKRRMPPRTKSGKFRKRRKAKSARRPRKVRRVRRAAKAKVRRRKSAKLTRRGPVSRSRRAAAKKGWSRRRRGMKSWAKTRRGKRRKFLRNPFKIGGRRGQFELIPSMKTLQGAAIKGAGAVASEIVKATAYSTLLAKFRPMGPTSVAEDTLARLASGAVTGIVAGYLGGAKMASEMVEGTYTVALYKLVSDVFARATQGKAKLFGFVANPFTAVPTMPILPALTGAGSEAGMSGMGRLAGVVPEGRVLPLGGVIPEGSVVPIGEDNAALPERFRSRF
jgi:hypothetical protein